MSRAFSSVQIRFANKLDLSTRLADICLEELDAKQKGNLRVLRLLQFESNAITSELQRRSDRIMEPVCL
jgi:hypothetical protein